MLRAQRSLKSYCATLGWKWRWRLDSSFCRVMEHRWNEIYRPKPKYSGKNLPQRQFFHHKCHMHWRRIECVECYFFLVVKGPAGDATDAPQPCGLLCNPVMKVTMMIIFCPFPSNGAPVEGNWQGKTEVLGEKSVPVPLCPPQIPHGLTRDWTRDSAAGGRRLTAWAMARPCVECYSISCLLRCS
jgi:hypothetical protein